MSNCSGTSSTKKPGRPLGVARAPRDRFGAQDRAGESELRRDKQLCHHGCRAIDSNVCMCPRRRRQAAYLASNIGTISKRRAATAPPSRSTPQQPRSGGTDRVSRISRLVSRLHILVCVAIAAMKRQLQQLDDKLGAASGRQYQKASDDEAS